MTEENSSFTLNYLNSVVLWNPLYYFSLFFFILALITFPISTKIGIFIIFVLFGVWTMIPGFLHFMFNRIVITDLLTYILAIYYGFFTALVYIIITMILNLYFGPKVWPFYVVRDNIGYLVASILVAIIPIFQEHMIFGFYVFLIIDYIVYYFLVIMFSPEEIGIEIIAFPTAFFFDFIWTGKGLKILENMIINLLNGEQSAGWILILIINIIVFISYFIKKFITKNNTKNIQKLNYNFQTKTYL